MSGVLDDCDDTFEFFGGNFTSAVQKMYEFAMLDKASFLITYRLFRSTSAFLHTKLEYRRPTPLILVKAYMIFCFPSTLVLRRRRMNWKFDFSPETSAR